VETCEEYIDSEKRAFLNDVRDIESVLASSGEKLSFAEVSSATRTVQPPFTHSVKLPPRKFELFAGDVETLSRFWEHFDSSCYMGPKVSP
jgi:hypothetical protein